MSGYQIIQERTPEKWKHLQPACISWSSGVGSDVRDLDFLTKEEFLSRFQDIVYCHDNDDAGRESAERVRSLIPTCKFIWMPLKDCNDMLMAHREAEAFSLMVFQGRTKSPDCAVEVHELREEALKPVEFGLSYPWDGLTQLTFGQRPELISIGGGTGSGKTLLAHQITAHNILVHGESGGIFLLEESAPMSLRHVAGKIAKTHFDRPDIPIDVDAFNRACDTLEGKLHIWRNKGANSWENIYACIRYWAVVQGCTFFMIDNMTTLVNHLSPTEQNTEIARIATACAGLVDELGIRIFVFSHLNSPGGSKSHETGAEVRENQFTGSRALQRWSHMVMGFQRNKSAEGEAKHRSKIVVLKDRAFGRTGYINTLYDVQTGCLNETDEEMTEGSEDDNQPFN
jgi:twinkle protein